MVCTMSMLIKLLPSLLEGASMSLFIFFGTLLVSYPLSLLFSYLYTLQIKGLNQLFRFYIMIERGTPLLLQLMFIYFGLPLLNISIDRMSSVFIAFILNYVAYFMEINRGGIESVDKGQEEAAKVLGYSKTQCFRYIILPQAFKITLPSLGNEALTLIKDTSLVTVLGVTELLKVGRNAVNVYATALPFIYVGVIYLIMTSMCSLIIKKIESRLSFYR